MLHEEITSQVIAAFYSVYNVLGYGFLEGSTKMPCFWNFRSAISGLYGRFPSKSIMKVWWLGSILPTC